ncbi:MMPL family transporter [Mariniflexile gromovii]|uniref:MMPL family transporter n=1 Tax=Mariniflexile gromovii TaxID=362523 RepID=A0ABS4BXF2_9FLAO|nr:MMPL family transporter [Mariniflexile gromovii]MBP0905266.1 MMPL family transporter [Mariniflexile gromovii]
MDKLFYNIYKRIHSNKILSLCVLLATIVGLGFLAYHLEFEEDITKLIPQTQESSEAQKVLKQVNFADKIIVNIQRQDQGTADDLITYAEAFIDSISKSSGQYIKQIQGRVEDDDVLNTLDFTYNNLPLFLNENDYQTITNKLYKDSIQSITSNNYKTLVSPSGFVAKDIILKDPLGLSFIGLKKLQELNIGDDFTLYNNFILSRDRNHVLLFITPTYNSNETDKNTLFANNLYKLQEALNSEFTNKASCEYFGGTLIAVANANQIKADIQITVSIAMSILLLILIFFYKRVSISIILFIPTVFGALVAMALLFLIRTKISAISLGIGSVLLGVTLDYALHILTHIRSNNNIKALYKEITKPVLMSSLTTALAFLCLLFIESQALQDLGIFAAVSVLSASVFALVFIPQVYKLQVKASTKKTVIDALASYPFHKKKWAIIGVVLVFVVSIFTYNKVTFNNDLNTLNFEPKALLDAQKRLDALTNLSSKSVYIAAYGDSDEDALLVNDAIFSKLKNLQTQDKILRFSSIGSLIHSKDVQTKKIQFWDAFWSSEKIEKTKTNLIESGNALGFKPSTFNRFYEHLHTAFKPLSVADYTHLKTIASEDFITSKENFTTITTLVKVQDENAQQLVDAFKNFKQTVVIDRKQMNETFLGNLKTDFNRLVLYSSIVVFLLLLLFYRSFSLTLVTAIPIGLTWMVTIGVMGLFGIQFNIFNIIISTFIFGLGIDYSIFITNALLHEYQTGEKTLPTHKTSIILSVVTTILGVGVLIFAKHPALHSIASVSIIGILSALAISFTLQPLLFKLFIGSKTKRPITLRLLLHSVFSFGYYGIGGFLLSLFSVTIIPLIPLSKKIKMMWFHKVLSKFIKSVLYTNPFVAKRIINLNNENFKKQAVIISNHTSFLDILAIGMLHPKIIFLVNDWVYNSPVFGKAVRMAGFYPVSSGIENGLSHLQKKVDQGYSLMAFPEGTRSTTNKIKRFHKGAFYLAEQFKLDMVPVLIHGNSEVNPKGSFIIKDGSITLKILDRIKANDTNFGENYTQRAKKIGAYFRNEFRVLRNNIEDAGYFHKIILEDFRYKGDAVYENVKQDLKTHKDAYKKIIDVLGKNETILHVSKDKGQLDFLMALDSSDRKIFTYLDDEHNNTILRHSFITNRQQNIKIFNTLDEVLSQNANAIIVNFETLNSNKLETILMHSYNLLIFIKESKAFISSVNTLNFDTVFENETMIILKPIPQI